MANGHLYCAVQVTERLEKFDSVMDSYTEDVEAACTLSKVNMHHTTVL